MAGTLTVIRPSENVARLRRYRLELDGVEIGRLRMNGSVSHDVAPGSHALRARIDWASSPPLHLDLADEEELCVECRARGGLLRASLAGIVRPGRYLELRVLR